jgi:hypothetical protein
MSKKPHCSKTASECKMVLGIKEINAFLIIPAGKITESNGHDTGSNSRKRISAGTTARNVLRNVAGCTTGGCECIQ